MKEREKEFTNLTEEELCDMMCGDPEPEGPEGGSEGEAEGACE